MRKNNWLSYFIYSVVLLCYIITSNKVLEYFNNESQHTYDAFPFILGSSVIFVTLGLLLGLEKFISEKRKDGNWKINLPKVLFLGIPSLYFSMGVFIYYCPIDFIRQALSHPISVFLKSNMSFIQAFQMILGFTISTSFIKVKEC